MVSKRLFRCAHSNDRKRLRGKYAKENFKRGVDGVSDFNNVVLSCRMQPS